MNAMWLCCHRKKLMNETARGEGFFAKLETQPYRPQGALIGQFYDDSCVAACCRMLLRDAVGEVAEAVLRAALETDRGAYLSAVPETLRQFGLPGYVYDPALSLAELQASTAKGPAIVAVKRRPGDVDAHALVIDRIVEQSVSIRDPLPEGTGSAYQVTVEALLSVWLRDESGTGRAVTVK
jgi:ABC-type bacteriocin/lantibiotic exporter with double-glycine peptidase domain